MQHHKSENTDTASNNRRIVKFYPAKAAGKEMAAVPEREQLRFVLSLTNLSNNMEATCTVNPLRALGPNVYELKENGRPAWRCVYYTGIKGVIYVLYVGEKTTNGVDRHLMSTVEQRLKALIAAIKAGDE
ncbi:type II toxin-antitoxin system RelE/ParE family toxin [Pseudomonas alliivorans]|nr:type II toxin-antitoxin system RelE/ParE family toxin [Pseudomonas alliivorans]